MNIYAGLMEDAHTILLASDCSLYSEGAMQEALFFGRACRAKIIFLHVVQTNAESLSSARALIKRRRDEITPYVDAFRVTAETAGVNYEIVVTGSSNPAWAIVQQARVRNADVIIMGRHGEGGRIATLMGNLTVNVINEGFPKVLVVPRDFTISGENVLLAVDDSPSSHLAAREALSIGKCCSTLRRMRVLSVAEREAHLPAAQELVGTICAQGRLAWPHVRFEEVVVVGRPADVIVEQAQDCRAEIVMMGGASKRFMPRVFLGRVTKEVCGRVACSVMVVTAQQDEETAG